MDEIQDGVSPHRPSLRIWLCGPFRIEWVDPATGETLPAQQDGQGRDVAQAHALLKLLLCQPERQAHRDWIMEQFWPDHDSSIATHRIENICSSLRKLLTPPTGGESLLRSLRGRKSRGILYALAAYPHIWVDSDALVWNVQQGARMDRFGDESLPFWQRAFDLLTRGPLLADEPYAEWVTERREMHEGYYRQCVHALSQLYVTRYGEAGKAEALLLLRTYWQQHKTDEDALRPMLELLGEQERYQEAEEYYQQFLRALTELNPTEDGKPRKPDSRTRDIHDYLGTKQIQRERVVSLYTRGVFSLFTYRRRRFSRCSIGRLKHESYQDYNTLLPIYTRGIAACQDLYFNGNPHQVEAILSLYCNQTTLLARQTSPLQQSSSQACLTGPAAFL